MEPELADVALSVYGNSAKDSQEKSVQTKLFSTARRKEKCGCNIVLPREIFKEYTLLTEFRMEDRSGFQNYMNMSNGHFNILLKKLI